MPMTWTAARARCGKPYFTARFTMVATLFQFNPYWRAVPCQLNSRASVATAFDSAVVTRAQGSAQGKSSTRTPHRRKIAHIRGPETSTALGRVEGYRRALAARQLSSLPGHIVSIGSSGDDRGEPGGYEAAKKLLSANPRPDGIFCFNDPIALGAMRAILDAG